MTFFGQLFSGGGFSFIAIIFTLLSLGNFVAALRLGNTLRQRWAEFTVNPLQRWHKGLAESAAFLIMVPPGVLLHELGHAVVVWAYGGKIVDVGYGFYWGYVVPVGTFTAAEDWFISLAGTLATLLYTAAFWLLLRRHQSEAVRFLALRGLRFHIQYALIYYPVFTALTFIGDWRIIYNFGATPLLSSVTLVVHVSLLGSFWWLDRRGWFNRSAFANEAERAQFDQLEQKLAAGVGDEATQLTYIRRLLRQDEAQAAAVAARRLIQQAPSSAEAHWLLALALTSGQRRVPRTAQAAAQRALDLGLKDPTGRVVLYDLLGRERLDREQIEEALVHYDRAVDAVRAIQDPTTQNQLHAVFFQRAYIQRRLGQFDAAARDLAEARRRAQVVKAESALNAYAQEQSALDNQMSQRQ